MICDNYYNYEQTSCLETIPDGFFCNNTEYKTIDKCHKNCKTCDKYPTNINNNCLTCIEPYIYYDLGNCRENCSNGYFTDVDQKLICKCTNNIKCYLCYENHLCKSCNTEIGFYPKNDEENIDEFVNCYNNPEGYYLDNNKYYPCYSTCKICTEQGNEDYNECTECKEGYEFKLDFANDKNCYNICEFNYYFDENKAYHCTANDDCPDGYSKLIPEQKKCIKINEVEMNTGQISTSNYLFSVTNTIEGYTECNFDDFLQNKCIISKPIQEIINKIRFSIIEGTNSLIKFMGNITLQLISYDRQSIINNSTNISIISLGECEEFLKLKYTFENSSLLLFKIDTKISGYNTMKVEYELYNPNDNSKLNLEYCNNSFVDIHIPVNINSNEVFKYNPKGGFYNDMCYPHTNEHNSDVILLDRKIEFINNKMTLCDEDCNFKRYDSDNKRAICKCKIKYHLEKIYDNIEIKQNILVQ